MNLILITLLIMASSTSCKRLQCARKFLPNELKHTTTSRNASNYKQCPKSKAKPKITYSKMKLEDSETKTHYYGSICLPAGNLSVKGTWNQIRLSKLPPVTLSHVINLEKTKYFQALPVGLKMYLYLLIENFSSELSKQTSLSCGVKITPNLNVTGLYEYFSSYISKPSLKKKTKRFFIELRHLIRILNTKNIGKRTYFSKRFEITEEDSDLYTMKLQMRLCETGDILYSSLIPSLQSDKLNYLALLIKSLCYY